MEELMKMQRFAKVLGEMQDLGLCFYYNGRFLTSQEVEDLGEDGQKEVTAYYNALLRSLWVFCGLSDFIDS